MFLKFIVDYLTSWSKHSYDAWVKAGKPDLF